MVELKDAASGELYRVHPDDVSLIADHGVDGASCLVALAGKQLVVEGSAAEIYKRIGDVIR